MTITLPDQPGTKTPLLVIRTRVLWVPVDELLGEILGPRLDMSDLTVRDETIDPERVLEARQVVGLAQALALAADMAAAHPEVGDRQRIKIVSVQ